MSESLIIKDGNGSLKSLQVNSGSAGYISNHALISAVTGSQVNSYSAGSGWSWGLGTASVADYDQTRKSIIISNNSEAGKCYVLMGSDDFGTITDIEIAPPKYTFLLDAGATYFGDHSTAALQHLIYVPSSSYAGSGQMTVTVTQVY